MGDEMLTAERLRELLNYDPETGVFTWATRKGPRAQIGAVAGCTRPDGYVTIRLDGKQHRSHRLAWLHFHGRWPNGEPDHRDGNPMNNAIDNLRELPHAINMQNRRQPRKGSRTGIIGVSVRPNGRFAAQLMLNGKQNHIGVFDTADEARAAYLRKKRELHPGCTI